MIKMRVDGGTVTVFVYRGTQDDKTQEPVGGYFGDQGAFNESWEV